VYGRRGRLFTVISILRVVCCGRIVGSRRGRVAHLRATDDKALGHPISFFLALLAHFPRQWPCLVLICLTTPYYNYLINICSWPLRHRYPQLSYPQSLFHSSPVPAIALGSSRASAPLPPDHPINVLAFFCSFKNLSCNLALSTQRCLNFRRRYDPPLFFLDLWP